MKITVKNLSETRVKLTIKLDASELKDAEQTALVRLAKDMKIQGFRKGKVPASVAAKNIDPASLAQATMEEALQHYTSQAFMDKKLQALDRPEVDVKDFKPGEAMEFTAEVDIVPEIKLGDYKNLKARAKTEKVTKKDVDEIIERMQKNFAERKDVDRAAKDGDEATIDFVGKKDGVAFDGGTGNDYPLVLGSGQFIPGFEEGIIGKKAGETFDLELTFPEDYHAKDLAGQKVVFTTTLKSVKEVVLPEVNDEFAAKCGPFTSADELKKDIESEIKAQKEREAAEKHKDELVKELVEISEVPAPEVLVKDQERSIEQDFQQNLIYQGLMLDQYLEMNSFKTKEEWLDKEVHHAALARVQAGLALAELTKKEKITATDEEIANHVELYKKQYANNKEMLKQFEREEVKRDISNRLLTEKTVERLVELNSK